MVSSLLKSCIDTMQGQITEVRGARRAFTGSRVKGQIPDLTNYRVQRMLDSSTYIPGNISMQISILRVSGQTLCQLPTACQEEEVMSLHVSVFTCVSTAVHAHCPIKTPHARLARALSPVNNSLAWQQVALTAGINIQLGEVILKLCTDARIFR